MKKSILFVFAVFSLTFSKAQTVPNGDMEAFFSCFAGGFIFGDWIEYGCTDPSVDVTPVVHAGINAMKISSDPSLIGAPVAHQDFFVGSAMPSCVNFWGKIDLNPGDSVKVKVYFNCNGGWFNCGNWSYTNANSSSLPYTQYNVPLNTAIMCLTGMDSMRIELYGGSIYTTGATNFYVDDVSFNCTTGINEPGAGNQILLFPNPAKEGINISSTEKVNSVKIFSVSGQLLFSNQASPVSFVDVSLLPAGIYFMECLSEKEIVRKKIEIIK